MFELYYLNCMFIILTNTFFHHFTCFTFYSVFLYLSLLASATPPNSSLASNTLFFYFFCFFICHVILLPCRRICLLLNCQMHCIYFYQSLFILSYLLQNYLISSLNAIPISVCYCNTFFFLFQSLLTPPNKFYLRSLPNAHFNANCLNLVLDNFSAYTKSLIYNLTQCFFMLFLSYE